MRRRAFLAAASATAVGCGGNRGAFRFLTDAQARTLDALLGCIIPADDAPGAREAGVVRYIDRQLTGHFSEFKGRYREGITEADRLAGGSFADASPARQLEIAQDLERGPHRAFFDLLVAHAQQGFYGDPRHGGNREFASWRMLGVPPVPIRGRDRYDLSKGGRDA